MSKLPPSLFAEDEEQFGAPRTAYASSFAAAAAASPTTGVVSGSNADGFGDVLTGVVVTSAGTATTAASAPSASAVTTSTAAAARSSKSVLRPAATAAAASFAAATPEAKIRAIVQKVYETQESKAPEIFERLCVRLVRDKIALEKKVDDLKQELVAEARIVSDLQTKLATFAATTFVAERQRPRETVHVAAVAPSPAAATPPVAVAAVSTAKSSTTTTTTATPAAAAAATAPDKKPVALPRTPPPEETVGGVGGLFRSVIDRVTGTQAATAAPAAVSSNGDGDGSKVDDDLRRQYDELFALNEELSVQIFEVKQGYEQKLREAQRAAQKREAQLLAEAGSLREQLAIAQDNYVRESRRCSEQEKVFRGSRAAVRQFEWLAAQIVHLDAIKSLRFGAVSAEQGTASPQPQSAVARADVSSRWQRASEAFQQLLDAVIRRLGDGAVQRASQQTAGAVAVGEAFHVRTLLQQWSHLEHLHAKCGSAAVRHRTRCSMVHVLRQSGAVVVPALVRLIWHETHERAASSQDTAGTAAAAAAVASPHVVRSADQAQTGLVAAAAGVLTQLLQQVCHLAGTWLDLVRQREQAAEAQNPRTLSENDVPALPPSLHAPVRRVVTWIRGMMKPAPSSVDYMKQLDEQQQDQRRDADGDAPLEAPRSALLLLVSAVLDAVERLLDPPVVRPVEAPATATILETAAVEPSRRQEERRARLLPAMKLAGRFLAESDPRHVFLAGAPLQGGKAPAQPRLTAAAAAASVVPPTTAAAVVDVPVRSSAAATTAGDSVTSRLLSQALAEVDSLVQQKEHLLLDRRHLTARVGALSDANKQLSAELQRRKADHEDTVATLHRQIETLSEALTETQQG